MRRWQNPLFRLAVFSVLVLAMAVIVAVGRIWENLRPDTFVAQVTPATDYELDQGVACDSLFINQNGKLFAVFLEAKKILMVDAATGTVEEQLDLSKKFRSVNHLLNGDRLYYFLDNTDILVLNPDTADVLDSFSDPKGRYYGRSVNADGEGRLIVSDSSFHLCVINGGTGDLIAQRRVSLLKGIVIGDGVIHYWEGFRVHAADPDTLEDIWAYGDDNTKGGANVTYSNGELYYNDFRTTMVFSSKTGSLLREFPQQASKLIVSGDRIFSRQTKVGVFCHQLQGTRVWEVMYPCNSLFMVGNYLYAESIPAGTITKLRAADGSPVYETAWDKGIVRTISQAGPLDVIPNTAGQVSLVDGTTGEELWRSIRPPRGQEAPWVLYDGHLILSNGRDKIISYNLKDVRP